MVRSVLIVDDDARIRAALSRALKSIKVDVKDASGAREALQLAEQEDFDLVLVDVRMPGMDGLELLSHLKGLRASPTVVMVTAHDDLQTVATAMREGAADFLVKPLDLHQLRRVVSRLLEDRRASQEFGVRPTPHLSQDGSVQIIGRDPRMIQIFKLIGQLAATRASLVIRGESGTGKELVARAIHASSPYANEPFVAVNCTSLPSSLLESELFGHVRGAFTGATSSRPGRFAKAACGTILLDEIGDTSLDFQAKLLRVLQEHEYFPVGCDTAHPMKARVLTATHRNLEAMVDEGSFRHDLYFRLRILEIVVPPLRERPSDIPLLTDHLLLKAAATTGQAGVALSEEARDILCGYSWPGNVRELENCLLRATLLASGDVVHPEHLILGGPENAISDRVSKQQPEGPGTLETVERDHVARVLKITGGHKGRAVEILGISRPRLARLIAKYQLDDD